MSKNLEFHCDNFRVNYVNNPGYSSANMSNYHAHDTYELYYLCNGERSYYVNGQRYYVKRGEIVLINRNIIHKTSTTNVRIMSVLYPNPEALLTANNLTISIDRVLTTFPVVSLDKSINR